MSNKKTQPAAAEQSAESAAAPTTSEELEQVQDGSESAEQADEASGAETAGDTNAPAVSASTNIADLSGEDPGLGSIDAAGDASAAVETVAFIVADAMVGIGTEGQYPSSHKIHRTAVAVTYHEDGSVSARAYIEEHPERFTRGGAIASVLGG